MNFAKNDVSCEMNQFTNSTTNFSRRTAQNYMTVSVRSIIYRSD